MKTRANQRILSVLLALVMVLALSCALLLVTAADEANHVTVNGTKYATLEAAIAEAEPVNGVITYEISGKVEVTSADGWIQVLKDGLTDVTAVKFVGKTENAEISITNSTSVLADQKYDLDVSFEGLVLSHPNGTWAGDLGHTTNYFACELRNSGAAENTVTYTNCTFPDGVCNNMYGKTVFDGCKFTNATSGKYNLWNYGGETEVKNSTFTGVRGIKTYNEGTLAVAPTVKIEDTSFTGLTEKAAIVASKATDITLVKVDATDCAEGVLQKAIASSGETTTIKANGTDISGSFNVTAETGTDAAKKEFNITGGTFKAEVSSDYCADGFEVKKTEDADGNIVYGVATASVAAIGENTYASLKDAIAAANDGDTITLLSNTKENVTIAKKLTLDLNGYTINGGTEAGKATLTITARVTIKDSSEAQTGTIMREDTAENSGISSYYVIDIQGNAWVIFEGGHVKNNSGTTDGTRKGASLVRIGDDSVANKDPGLNIKGGTFTQDNFVAIKVDRGNLFVNGGTINSQNDEAIKNWLRTTIKGGIINGTVTSWVYGSGSATSTLTIKGGTINGNVYSMSYDGAEGKQAKVVITAGTITGELGTYQGKNIQNKTELADKTKATIEVTGGIFSKDPTAYVTEEGKVSGNDSDGYNVEKKYLAKVGDTSYYTMDEAFKAQTSSGEPIVLLRDYTTDKVFNSGSINRVLDLSGFTYTYTRADGDAAFEINYPNVALTVKNGTVVSASRIAIVPTAMGGTILYGKSGLVFDGVRMTANGASGIETNGNNENVTITLKNSTLNVPNGYGIYFPSSGTLTIEDTAITAETMGVQICAGKLNISGNSSITVNGNAVPKTENDGAIEDGAAISIVDRTGYKGLGKITVAGGTFIAQNGEAVKAYKWANNTESAFDNANGTVSVSGGTFSSEIPYEFCADTFIPTVNDDGTYGVKEAEKGSEKNPYTLEEFGAMTRGDYIAAQARLGGTMYVTVGDYRYDKYGVLGNGERNDTPGQIPDHSKLNAYGENGYLGDKNDGANGNSVVFVKGTITSGATGYTSIDNIGTSLLLAVPAYTHVTFEGITFNNVFSFDYQLYTSPWSQLGSLSFDGCTFNGIVVGAIASQELRFTGCTFTKYENTAGANNSNPLWVRPAYGNWTKGDNEGQGDNFKSLVNIVFENNTVKSTRPVKFERIAQWEMDTAVTATGNEFDITDDGSGKTKNVGLYFGANARFDLVLEKNTKTEGTAALYTAVYNAPDSKSYAGLPAGSTVKNKAGEEVTVSDAYAWKTTDVITLKTTAEVAEVGGVKFATIEEAFAAAQSGDTITLVANADMTSTIYITDGRKLTLALNGFDVTITETGKNFRVCNAEFTVTGNGTIREQNPYFAPIILKGGPEGSVDYTVVNIGAGVVLEGWAGVMVDQTLNTANNYGMTLNVDGATLRGVNDTDGASGSGLYVNGVVCDAKITLTNTTVTGTGTGMYLAGYAETTINGGSVTGDLTGIEIRAGKLTLNNCDVTGGNGELKATANGNGATVENAALAVSQHTTKKPIEVVINGGTFTATAAVYQTDVQGTGSADVKTSVKDGNFNGTVEAETAGTVAVSGGTFSAALDETVCAPGFIPKANDDGTYGVKEGTYVARINGVGYETLAEAIAAANAGDTVTILSDITGENVTVDKSLVIAGNNTAALTNVIITASGRISLTLQGLKFSGNSYVNANGCEALTVENCEADVTPTKITGRAAFIVLGTAEVGDGAKGLTLVVRDSTIIASKGENANGDAFAAAIFGWNFIKSADISGNIFGSETTPYTFIAVKLMNVTADAKFTVTGNTVYGTNETYGFYAFDLYQNNSRENAYETVFSGNELRNTNTGVSENDFYFVDVEANGTGNAKVNVKSDNKVNGEVVKASDLLVEEKGNNRYVGIDIVTDEAGKIIGGILAANSGTDELADGFTAVKNEDGSCTVKAEVIVIVTSDPENSGILSGGGKYAEGTEVTLVARAVTDYTFLGWYDKDGVLVSADLAYTFTATADASFTAKFKSDAKRKLTVSVGHGEVEYTYENADGTGTDTWENDITDNLFARGTRFTVTAKPLTGYTFLCWINADGRILTEEATYEFWLGDNVKLTACYRKTEGAKPYVIFRDLNDKILQAGDATDGYVTVPAHNTFAGYTFLGWFDAEGNELTVTDGRIAVTGNLTVYARYKANDGLTLIVDGTADMETYSYGDKVTVTADEMKDGKYFSGWYIGDMIVSDRLGYTFYITGDTVLETRYEGDAPLVRQPIAAMTVSDRQTLEDGRQSVTFYVSWTLPEGYEMVEAGVILTPSEAKKDVLTLPISEADKNTIFKYSSILTGDTGTYAYTQNLKGNARSWNVYAVGYVIYRDAAGNTMTLYTSVFTSAAQ